MNSKITLQIISFSVVVQTNYLLKNQALGLEVSS